MQCRHDIPHIHPSGCQGDGSALCCWASECGLSNETRVIGKCKRAQGRQKTVGHLRLKALKECLECKKVQGNFKVFVANYLSLLEKVTTQRFTFTKWDCMVTDTVKTENSRKKVHTTLSKKHLSRQKVYTAYILHAKFTPIQQKNQTTCCYAKKRKKRKTPEKLYQNRRTEYASNDFCTSIFLADPKPFTPDTSHQGSLHGKQFNSNLV